MLIINRIRKWFRYFWLGFMGKYVCEWKLVIFMGGLGVLMIKGIMKINYKIVNYYII